MAKTPEGKRTTPRVAKGKSPSFNNDSMGGYSGSRGTKTPTGNRPVPSVPADHPPTATVPGPVKAPIRRTSMPTPNRDATSSNKGRANGGGSY